MTHHDPTLVDRLAPPRFRRALRVIATVVIGISLGFAFPAIGLLAGIYGGATLLGFGVSANMAAALPLTGAALGVLPLWGVVKLLESV